jgi:hypothetical protein
MLPNPSKQFRVADEERDRGSMFDSRTRGELNALALRRGR